MKQIRFAFLMERHRELTVVLEQKIEAKLVVYMADAIVAVFKKGGIETDERSADSK